MSTPHNRLKGLRPTRAAPSGAGEPAPLRGQPPLGRVWGPSENRFLDVIDPQESPISSAFAILLHPRENLVSRGPPQNWGPYGAPRR